MADDAPKTLEAFRHFREKMNAAVLAADNLTIKRFFALDTRAYEDGALPARALPSVTSRTVAPPARCAGRRRSPLR